MNKIENIKPCLRFVKHKVCANSEGVHTIERVYVLTPVIAKPKQRLTKEQVADKKLAKVYKSTGISEKIPYDDTIEDNTRHWKSLETGKKTIELYRETKKKLDSEITETITVAGKFIVKIKHKREFKPRPSMKLSSDERNTRMIEHKKTSKALRIVKQGKMNAAKKNSNGYVYNEYIPNIKAQKERQTEFWKKHNDVITKVVAYLKSKRPNPSMRIEKVFKYGDTYTSVTVKPKVTFDRGTQAVNKAVVENKAKDAVHVFGVDRKDNVPAIGMKIAA